MTLRHSTIWCLLYAGLAWVGPAALAGETRGTVCVAPIPRDGVWKGNDTGATLASTFTIQIDELSAITVTTNLSGVFTNLALGQKHMVKILMDGKPRESFPLRFETFEKGAGDKVVHIRLRYDTMYGYWHPGRVDTSPCRCQKSTSNQKAAANYRPAGQWDRSGNLLAIVAVDRAFPAAVVELGQPMSLCLSQKNL